MAADPLTSRTVDSLMLEDNSFNFDDDPFADPRPANAERDDKAVLSPRKRKADDTSFGKNLDEEIKITKQRKKIPKLDAERLLSEPGIPHIRKLMRSGQLQKKLKLKGKGHEFDDVTRLLNFYQNWLDSLYPRAKFADALLLVEKAGHTKKMQMYRKSWMDEGKPGHIRKEDLPTEMEEHDHNDMPTMASARSDPPVQNENPVDTAEDPASLFFGNDDDDTTAPDGPDDDELDALLAEGAQNSGDNTKSKIQLEVDSEGEDDLDALLAEESSSRRTRPETERPGREEHVIDPREEADHEDDLDVLLNAQTVQDNARVLSETLEIDDEEDQDDLDTLLADHQGYEVQEPELPTIQHSPVHLDVPDKSLPGSEEVPDLDNVLSSSPIPNVRTDELDDLMDQCEAQTGSKKLDTQLSADILSSPIPNRNSQ